MKFHSLEKLREIHHTGTGARLLRIAFAAIAGIVVLGALTMALPLG
jgi:hypothetical protein